tara:strand:- start:62 stop:397 length:336 start_codon:yes stop_codon:yes gene_type:complete
MSYNNKQFIEGRMVTIYDRSDLVQHSFEKHIKDIKLSDIRFSSQYAQLSAAIIFVDRELGLMRIMKHRYVDNFDTNGVFSIDELADVINDGIKDRKNIGRSILKPGTKNKR